MTVPMSHCVVFALNQRLFTESDMVEARQMVYNRLHEKSRADEISVRIERGSYLTSQNSSPSLKDDIQC